MPCFGDSVRYSQSLVQLMTIVVCLTAEMYADEGYCVSTCGAGSRADENNTCVKCDGECELKSRLYTCLFLAYLYYVDSTKHRTGPHWTSGAVRCGVSSDRIT